MKNKKAQAGLPINYTIVLVISVLVIALVFLAAIRFELVDRLRGLPVGDEEEEVDEVVADESACPEKIGYLALPTEEDYSTSYRYIYYMDGKPIPVYKDKQALRIHEWQGFFSGLAYDSQIGSFLDLGNDYLVFNCDAYQIAKSEDSDTTLTQEDVDYFQGSYTIPGFVQEGRQIICKDKETASKIGCLEIS